MNDFDAAAWVAENVFTFPEAAEYLHMTRQGISKAVKEGQLRAIRGKLILKPDLDRYDATVIHRRPRSR